MTETLVRAHLHPAYQTGERVMRVAAIDTSVPDVLSIELAADGPLASFQSGSHLIVSPGPDSVAGVAPWRNAYSLTGDGVLPTSYTISVLRRDGGLGSVWLHDHLTVGMDLMVEGPRAMFPPETGQHRALLLAGGIGVTPIVSHARALARGAIPATVLYSYRPGRAAHLDDLRALAADGAITLVETTTVEQTQSAVADLLADQPLGTHAYACGPLPFLDFYLSATAAAGWPASRVHLERFESPDLAPGEEFVVRVASTGQQIQVGPGVSMLTALEEAGLEMASLCREGICGECMTDVISSRGLEHRDFVLTDEEKKAGNLVMPCVSRAIEIEVDL